MRKLATSIGSNAEIVESGMTDRIAVPRLWTRALGLVPADGYGRLMLSLDPLGESESANWNCLCGGIRLFN